MNRRKIAIPLFGEKISPRCEYTDSLLVIEFENGGIESRTVEDLATCDTIKKAARIKALGITTVICCGISGFFSRMLEANGIKVIQSETFDVEEVLDCLEKGGLKEMEQKSRRRRNRHCARGGNRCRRT